MSVDIEVRESGRKAPKWTLQSDINGEVSLEQFLRFTKTALLRIAETVLKEEQGKGFDKEPLTVVDGNPNKPVIAVSPLGRIEFVARSLFLEDLADLYKLILDRSKIVTGLYVEHNYVFFNNRVIATNLAELEAWIEKSPRVAAGDKINFVNIVPYARRLETLGVRAGVTQNRRQNYSKSSQSKYNKSGKFAVPNGAYYLSFRAMRRKFKANFSIKFDFLTGASMGLDRINIVDKSGRKLRNNFGPDSTTPGRSYLYPTIQIIIKEGGIR